MIESRRTASALTAAMLVLAIGRAASAQPAPFTSGNAFLSTAVRMAGESASWIAAIARRGVMPRVERLLVVASDGRVLDTIDGTESHVVLPRALQGKLFDSSNRITLVHNHPGSTSLSGADLSQLGKPGVARIVALGNDGSIYEASAGPRFDPQAFFKALYPAVHGRILFMLDVEQHRSGEDLTDGYQLVAHLAAIVLDRAGVISYRATLSREQAALFARFEEQFDDVLKLESQQLERGFSQALRQ